MMPERPKFCGLDVTRSVRDRIFLGVMGLLFMLLTGFMLYTIHTTVSWREMSNGEFLLAVFVDEIVLTIFLPATCYFIWASQRRNGLNVISPGSFSSFFWF